MACGAVDVHKVLTVKWENRDPLNYERRLITVNGLFPSPTLEFTQGDNAVITVINHLDVGTCIHWHGIEYPVDTNDMDGVPYMTQDLIPSGGFKVYNFTVDIPGSYWYHSHYNMQLTDGLKGAFVVYPKGVKRVRDDLVLTMTDWYHGRAKVLLNDDFLVPSSGGAEPVPDGALLNGIGQHACLALENGGTSTPGAAPCPYSRLMVTPGGTAKAPTIRLRLISVASFAAFNITVDGHNMQVVAVDATPIVPVNVGHIRINTGQRYDVMLTRTDGGFGKGAFWIRGQFDQDVFDHSSKHAEVRAILQYNTNPYACPTSTFNARGYALGARYTELGYNVDPYGLHSSQAGLYPVPQPNMTLHTSVIFRPNAQGVTLGTFDNHPWEYKPVAGSPTLLARIKAQDPTPFPWSAPTHWFNLNDVIMIVMNNTDTGEHPMHLHGQSFYVLARGKDGDGPYNATDHALNFVNPIVRDTVTIAAQSYIVLLFVATHPGVWFFHCHIEWHISAGLAMALVVTKYHNNNTDTPAMQAIYPQAPDYLAYLST